MNRTLALSAVLVAGCGDRVAPAARPVRFLAQVMADSPIALNAAAIRAEAADGSVIEAQTAADGTATLMLTTDIRWDVTFAGAAVYPLSILGLRPEAANENIGVLLRLRSESERHLGTSQTTGEVVPSTADVRHLVVRIRNYRATQTGSDFAIHTGPFLGAQRWTGSNPDAMLEYDFEFASFASAPPIELWAGETINEPSISRAARSRPHRGVFKRISPRPTQDSVLEIDYNESVGAPTEQLTVASWQNAGILAQLTPAENSLPQLERAYAEWLPGMSSFVIGQLATLPAETSNSVRLRTVLSTDQWTLADSLGRLAASRASIFIQHSNEPAVELRFATDPQHPSTMDVPSVQALASSGASIASTQFELSGNYPQGGFEVRSAPSAVSAGTTLWEGWLFDPPSTTAITRFRVPRLPTGYTLRQLTTSSSFNANALMTTLPRATPGYSVHRAAWSPITVVTAAPSVAAGDR